MIWFATLLILVLIVAAIVYEANYGDGYYNDAGFAFFTVCVALVIGGAVAWGVFQLIGSHNTRVAQANGNAVVVWEQKTPLRALNTDSASFGGSTFLTMGYVGGDRVYSYIYETDDGGFIVDTAWLGSAMVYEVDGLEEPYMREFRSRGSWWLTWTALPERTEFYVPTGSVQDESYDVSIEGKVG